MLFSYLEAYLASEDHAISFLYRHFQILLSRLKVIMNVSTWSFNYLSMNEVLSKQHIFGSFWCYLNFIIVDCHILPFKYVSIFFFHYIHSDLLSVVFNLNNGRNWLLCFLFLRLFKRVLSLVMRFEWVSFCFSVHCF